MGADAARMREIARLPRRKKTPVLNRFAALIARGNTPRDAAAKMGRPRCFGDQMMVRLRKAMGPQAR